MVVKGTFGEFRETAKHPWIDIWPRFALETARPGRRGRRRDEIVFSMVGLPPGYSRVKPG